MINNIGYTTTARDTKVWSVGDVIFNTTTNELQRWTGSIWVVLSSNITRSVQSTRRTVGSPSNYYPNYATTSNLDYIGIDYPDVALKGNTTYRDTWTKLIAPPIAAAASSVLSTGFTANWTLDTYWNSTAFVNEVFTSYELTISTSSTFASGNTVISNLSTTSYVATGLIAATTYYYRVRLINGNDTSDYSSTITQATAAALTQNEWLASYANNLYLNTSGTVPKQANTITSTNIGSVDVWGVFNIAASTPATSAHVFNLSDATPTRKGFLRNSGATYTANILITNDAAATDSTSGTPTNVMNAACRLLWVKSGTTVTVYKDNLSTVVATLNVTTATGTSTITRLHIGQDHTGANVWAGVIQKAAFFTGALPATADQMLAAL
jgi:hypothetical protein